MVCQVEYADTDGDRILFRVEDGEMIKHVNGQRRVGRGDTSGRVTKLRFSAPARVSDQHGWGGNVPAATLPALKALATEANIPNNLPQHR